MNNMIEFAKQNRTTTFFRSRAILEIRIAYRIMEYLAPDDVFKPTVNQFTKDLMLKEEHHKAYEYVMEELSLGYDTDLGCSDGMDAVEQEAIQLIEYLLPFYKQGVADDKEKRRIQLLQELKNLDRAP